jgi:hypothetical protein
MSKSLNVTAALALDCAFFLGRRSKTSCVDGMRGLM